MKMYGPYTRKDGRKHAIFVKEDGTKTTKSWPRVLMEAHLGRELLPEETVDHIDGDFRNDSIENLQILSLSDNAKKAIPPAEIITLSCKHCGKIFQRRKALYLYETQIRKKDGPFCSRTCVGKVHN